MVSLLSYQSPSPSHHAKATTPWMRQCVYRMGAINHTRCRVGASDTIGTTRHGYHLEFNNMTKIDFARVQFTLELDEPPPTLRSNVKRRKDGGMYNDAMYTAYRQRIQSETRERLPDILLDGLVILRTHFSFPLPKTLNGVRKQYKKDRGPEGVPHTVRPDLSNLIKPIEDSLEGVFYRNDGQIATLISGKSYHSTNGKSNEWFADPDIVSGDKWYVMVDCEGIGEWRKRDDDQGD